MRPVLFVRAQSYYSAGLPPPLISAAAGINPHFKPVRAAQKHCAFNRL